mmetsp:Transcript_26275/g.46596  ORF Transcript_26275/g.46596 Transcript_26275/m.46596 type:complete len:80 (-) Transcript_26275:565-804(-)
MQKTRFENKIYITSKALKSTNTKLFFNALSLRRIHIHVSSRLFWVGKRQTQCGDSFKGASSWCSSIHQVRVKEHQKWQE